jgi:hypothetical protein
MSRAHVLLGLTLLLGALTLGCSSRATPTPSTAADTIVRGIVVDESGHPVAGATVRIQAMDHETLTDAAGQFTLLGLAADTDYRVSAWQQGYYCALKPDVATAAQDLVLTLRRYQTDDNPAYDWVAPVGQNSCYSCKPSLTQVWLDNDAHARSAVNPRFLTMYNGTDVAGNSSPPTRYGFTRDYGRFSLPPDLSRPYFGPGYRLDFPLMAGNCAACHVPGAAIESPYGTDPNTARGVDTYGAHCDFCHKVADVRLDPATGLPYTNMPGVLSMQMRRPFSEDPERYQLFFGTFDDDNVPEEDTYLPLIESSQYCAPCHHGVFWDTVVYNSFGEWLESPYNDPNWEGARTCQQCHMPAPTLADGEPITNVAPGAGGIERDPLSIHAHTFPGASSVDLLQNAVTMKVKAHRTGDQIAVDVTLVNDQTGHDVPTDSPLRHLILLVEATGPGDGLLPQVAGPVIPEWGGVGDPAIGYYAGLPGKAYAKILTESWTGVTPTGAYWNPTRLISDNRLAAFESDTSAYLFETSEAPTSITVTLLFRRAFIELMDQKGWDVPDVLMEQAIIVVP